MEYQLLTFGGLLINVWGPTWDWTANINYHKLLIQAVLIQTGSTVLTKQQLLSYKINYSQGKHKP